MGLVRGFVLAVNRRAVLAALAIGVSVSYALVAGAAVGGLGQAQDVLAQDLQDTTLVAGDPDGEALDPGEVDPGPDVALATTPIEDLDRTAYTVREGPGGVENASRVHVGPGTEIATRENVTLAGENRTVTVTQPPPGAQRGWLGVHETVFDALGGEDPPLAHVLAYEAGEADLAEDLRAQGLAVDEAPGAFGFYTGGAEQLVSAVQVTVFGSALVVALIASTVVSLELNAKRSSFATLQVYAGRGLVQRLVAGRGATLLGAGHALGIGATLGLLFVLERAGAATLSLPPDFLALALGATGGVGLLGLAWPIRQAGQPLTAEDLGEDEPPLDLPRPLRLTLTSWRTVVPLAVAAAVLAASLGVIFGAVDMPDQVFGTDDAEVIADVSNNPLRGQAPLFLGTRLGDVDGFEASSPEIYVPTTIRGEPVMVRGVHWDNLARMNEITLVEGEPASAADEAVVGHRAARTLDLDVGERLRVPAAYRASASTFTVTGVARADGLLGDEVLVPVEAAQALTELGPDSVNLVRYRLENGTLPPGEEVDLPGGLEATRLTVQPERPTPRQQANATVHLVNFDDQARSRSLTLTANGEPVADAHATVPGKDTGTAVMDFRVPATGIVNLSVNPERTVETDDPAYRLDAPAAVRAGSEAEVRVETREGDPAGDVEVALGDATDTTDADGEARLPATEVGNRTILAEGPEGTGSTTTVVVEPGDLHRSRIQIRSLSGPSTSGDGSWEGTAYVENVGGEAHDGLFTVPVDGTPQNATEVRVLSGQTERATFTLDLPEGTVPVGPEDARVTVTVASGSDPGTGGGNGTGGNGTDGDGEGGGGEGTDGEDGGGEPTFRELLEQRVENQGSGDDGSAETDPLDAFLDETFENVDAAVTVVTIATVLHAGLIGLVAVRRDVEENADTLGTMASVGADRGSLRAHALKEFALVGTLAAVLGTALGLGAVQLAASWGLIGGFGHALVPRTGLGFALRVAAVSLAVTLGAAVLAVERVRGEDLQALLQQGPARTPRPPLEELVGGTRS
jgi:hypothetical protein